MKFTALPSLTLLLFAANSNLCQSLVHDVPSSVKIRPNDIGGTAEKVDSVLQAGALAWISSNDDSSWSDNMLSAKKYKSDKVKRVLDSSTVQLEKSGNVSLQTVRGAWWTTLSSAPQSRADLELIL